jgi:hypothetical protein
MTYKYTVHLIEEDIKVNSLKALRIFTLCTIYYADLNATNSSPFVA